MLVVVETVFVACLLVGVALMHPPSALMLGGALGVLACERRSARVARGEAGVS